MNYNDVLGQYFFIYHQFALTVYLYVRLGLGYANSGMYFAQDKV